MQARRNDIKNRRSIRLKDFDYSWPGFYFVTICVKNRACVLGKIIECGGETDMELSPLGKIVKKVWESIPLHHKSVDLYEYMIMPNHIHGIIYIAGRGDARIAPTRRTFEKQPSGSLSTIIGSYKSEASKQIHLLPNWRQFKWQRNYYEHIIRNEKSMQNIQEYIIDNPRKWNGDIENPENDSDKVKIRNYYNKLFY